MHRVLCYFNILTCALSTNAPIANIFVVLCTSKILTGVAGFEPTMTESKSDALPLGYTPKVLRLL